MATSGCVFCDIIAGEADASVVVREDGAAAGQSVDHVHLHVIPRFDDDGFGLRFPPHYPTEVSLEERNLVAESIRRGLTGSGQGDRGPR